MASHKRLQGKVAIITGGASGIGASAARLFHENGAKVAIADIQDELGQALADELGENTSYFHCNVSNEKDIEILIDPVVKKHGKLNVMYNNAGVIDKPNGGILGLTKEDLEKVVRVNLVGAFLGAKHASRVMIPRRDGCILFTTSVAASIAGLSTHTYAASKSAVLGLARNLAGELGEFGVRVNCIAPYGLVTGIGGPIDEHSRPQIEQYLSEMGNLKTRVLRVEDVAKAVLFLASDDAQYVSGLNLLVDGGFSIVNPTFALSARL